MSALPLAIPRALDFQKFTADPLAFLGQARSALGDLFVLREEGAIFSRASGCPGVVAVFGAVGQSVVLSDIETFGMPVSAALHLKLPPAIVNLNLGLHSMRGEQHAAHRRLLTTVLNDAAAPCHDHILVALESFTQSWRAGAELRMLEAMRGLALEIAKCVLFDDGLAHHSELASLLDTYFHLRREVSSPFGSAHPGGREALVALGTSLDDALRRYIRHCRGPGRDSTKGLIARLAQAGAETGTSLDENTVVGHANVVFVSSTEPIAVALTWVLLLLSQLPDLRDQIRKDLARSEPSSVGVLLDRILDECLRLLPPNAIMVRATTRSTRLLNVSLPPGCEIILSPFLSHRDPERFPHPTHFVPARWATAKPSPFEYFPFGAGGHACAGRGLAYHLLKTAMVFLLQRYDLVLSSDQEVDWRIHIQFMPRIDPRIWVQAAGTPSARQAGRLRGPVARLVCLPGQR